MPSSIIKKYSKEANKNTKEVEALWDKAVSIVKDQGKKESDKYFYATVVTILKKMLGINENIIDFSDFCLVNEIKTKAKALHSGKPLWNGKDYLDSDGDIDLRRKKLTELPCVFPEKWEKGFYCNYNQLTTLAGAPEKVGGRFDCYYNQLTTLEGAPREVGGDFICGYNKLTSLEGAPKEVGEYFRCSNNPTKFTKKQVRDICNVRGKIDV